MEEKDTSKKPLDTAFRQQHLKAWQPLLTPPYIIGTFCLVGIIFAVIGAIIITTTNNVVELQYRYDNLGGSTNNSSCNLSSSLTQPTSSCFALHITSAMSPPIYVYYKLSNFYQNHRRYVKSRSDSQLEGSDSPSLSTCDPLQYSADNTETLYPCGLIAVSTFNDTINATWCTGNGNSQCTDLSSDTFIDNNNPAWQKSGIAWDSDVDLKFKYNPAYLDPSSSYHMTNVSPDGHILPRVDDEDFIVWMRTSGLPTFKKLYRKITNISLSVGDVLVFSVNDVFPVDSFNGQKWVVLSTTSWLGGRNQFLGWAYVTVGIACVCIALLFLLKHLLKPRPLGDLKYFRWTNQTKQQHAKKIGKDGSSATSGQQGGGGGGSNTQARRRGNKADDTERKS